jgi:hypothetical protein
MTDTVIILLEFGLGGAVISLISLLYVRREKAKLRRSVLRYEKIKRELGE